MDKNNINLMKYTEVIVGLVACVGTLYYSSMQWEKSQIEVLHEVKELRKENVRINDDLFNIATITKNSEQMIIKHDIKLNTLDLKIDTIEKEFKELLKKK